MEGGELGGDLTGEGEEFFVVSFEWDGHCVFLFLMEMVCSDEICIVG